MKQKKIAIFAGSILLALIMAYNSENPIDPAWNRSVNSLVDE